MASKNGQEYQHALIKITLDDGVGDSFKVKTFSDVSYDDGADKKPIRDYLGNIIGYVTGDRSTDGSVTLLLSEWFALKDFLAGIYQVGPGQIPLNWTVVYGNSFVDYKTDTLIGVMFQKEAKKSSSDQSGLYVTVPLFVRDVNPSAPFIQYAA